MAGEENFLSRWSRRKTQAAATAPGEPKPAAGPSAAAAGPLPAPGSSAPPGPAEAEPLPSLESLTPESDFAPFMAPEVDGDTRRKALKTLFTDPRFNTMDMMDVYVDDYSKPDPIPAEWLDNLVELSRLGDRAGRDREEEERRRALAGEPAAATGASPAASPESDAPPAGTPPADTPPADTPPGAAGVRETDRAGLPREGSRSADAQAPIPPLESGESGP